MFKNLKKKSGREHKHSSSSEPFLFMMSGIFRSGMLVIEYLEDLIVIWQIVPMSPVVEDFVAANLRKEGPARHAAMMSMDLRIAEASNSGSVWRLHELESHSKKMSSIVPMPEETPEKSEDSKNSGALVPSRSSRHSHSNERAGQEMPDSVEAPQIGQPEPPSEAFPDGAPVPSMQLLSVGQVGDDETKRPASVLNIPNPPRTPGSFFFFFFCVARRGTGVFPPENELVDQNMLVWACLQKSYTPNIYP